MPPKARVVEVIGFDNDFDLGKLKGCAELVVEVLEGVFKQEDLVTVQGIAGEMRIAGIPIFHPYDPKRSPSLVVTKPSKDRLPVEPGAIIEGVEKE